jgi:hypothetical protein
MRQHRDSMPVLAYCALFARRHSRHGPSWCRRSSSSSQCARLCGFSSYGWQCSPLVARACGRRRPRSLWRLGYLRHLGSLSHGRCMACREPTSSVCIYAFYFCWRALALLQRPMARVHHDAPFWRAGGHVCWHHFPVLDSTHSSYASRMAPDSTGTGSQCPRPGTTSWHRLDCRLGGFLPHHT